MTGSVIKTYWLLDAVCRAQAFDPARGYQPIGPDTAAGEERGQIAGCHVIGEGPARLFGVGAFVGLDGGCEPAKQTTWKWRQVSADGRTRRKIESEPGASHCCASYEGQILVSSIWLLLAAKNLSCKSVTIFINPLKL